MKTTLKSSNASLSIKQQNLFSHLTNLQQSENTRFNISSNRYFFHQDCMQFVSSPKNKKIIHLGKCKRKHNQTDNQSMLNNQMTDSMPSIPRVLKKSAQKDKQSCRSKNMERKEVSMYDDKQDTNTEDITPIQQTYQRKCFGRNAGCFFSKSISASPNKFQQNSQNLESEQSIIFTHDKKITEKLSKCALPLNPTKICLGQSNTNIQSSQIITNINHQRQQTQSLSQASIYCSLGKILCNYYQQTKKPKEIIPDVLQTLISDCYKPEKQNFVNACSSLEATKYKMEKFQETRGQFQKQNRFKNKKRVFSCQKIVKKSLSSQKKSQHQKKAIQNLKKHRFIANYISNYELEKFYNKLILEGVPEQKWSIVIIDQVYKKIKQGKKQL